MFIFVSICVYGCGCVCAYVMVVYYYVNVCVRILIFVSPFFVSAHRHKLGDCVVDNPIVYLSISSLTNWCP